MKVEDSKMYTNTNVRAFHRILPKNLDRQAYANIVDPNQTPQNATSDWGQRCLPLIQQFLDTSTGNKIKLFKFKKSYGKENKISALYKHVAQPRYTNICLATCVNSTV